MNTLTAAFKRQAFNQILTHIAISLASYSHLNDPSVNQITDYEEALKITILISLFEAFEYRRYLTKFNINNKLHNYIRGREYYKIISVAIIIEIIVAIYISIFVVKSKSIYSFSLLTFTSAESITFKAIVITSIEIFLLVIQELIVLVIS